MIIDADEVERWTDLDTPVCIIGAGPAGITLAKRLAVLNIQSVLLESGGLQYTPHAQNLYHGFDTGLPYFSLVSTRLRYFGGATNHWGANCFPFSQKGIQARPWVGLEAWPLDYAQLTAGYTEAAKLLGLPEHTWDAVRWAKQAGGALPSFREGLIEPYIVQIARPEYRRFNQRFEPEFANSEKISLYTGANATEFLTQPHSSVVDRVEVQTLAGNQFRVKARYFVLAAGGIENARLLLACQNDTEHGLGNENDLVGRYFMDHPRFIGGRVLPKDNFRIGPLSGISRAAGRRFQIQFRISEAAQRSRRLMQSSVVMGDMLEEQFQGLESSEGVEATKSLLRNLRAGRTDLISAEEMLGLWENFDDLSKLGYARARYGDNLPLDYIYCWVRLEPHPNPNSRVTLARERDPLGMPRAVMHWQLDEIDKRTAQQTMHVLAEEVTKSGLGRVQSFIDEPDWSWPDGNEGGHHQVGTTRMDDDPKRGVVDRNGRMHRKQNFFIAGSSIFPTADMGWPTMTIIALAINQANYIAGLFEQV